MKEKSKLTTKKLIIIVAIFFVVCCGALGTIALARNAVRKVQTDVEYGYVNPDETKAEADDGFVIDGVLDEEEYQNNNWLYLHNENGDSTVDIATTSYYGEKGLYFVWDVTESTPIYVNLTRPSYLNSSVELYLAPNGVKNMNTNDIFEIDMLPTGDMVFKQRNGKNGWMNVPTTDDIMAYLGATTKGGDLNTGKCQGYNLELFIPWEYMEHLGIDANDMKKDFVYANTAHNTSFNYEGTNADIDRYWYSFATQLGGSGFGDVEQYFKFDGSGAIGTVPITFKQGEHYTISGAKSVMPGLKVRVDITPEEGYALNSILIDGQEWIKKVSYNKDGSVSLLVKGAKKAMTISASTEAVSQGNKNLKGTVILNKLDGDTLNGVSISYTGPQGEKPIELDSNGQFELKDLAQGYYTIVVEKQGYEKLVRKICLNRDIETDLILEYQLFEVENQNEWDVDDQNNGIVVKKSRRKDYIFTKDGYKNFSLEANLKYSDALAKMSDGDEYVQQRCGLRINFSNDRTWHIDILYQDGEYIVQYAKHTSDKSVFGWTTVHVLTKDDIAKYKSAEGIKLKVVREGQYANVYLGNKLIAVEKLDNEYKTCTARLGFEYYIANQEFIETQFNITTKNIKVVKDAIFARGGRWDISKQFDGVVTLNKGGTDSISFAKEYSNIDLTIWMKNDPNGVDEPGTESPRTDVKFLFADGKVQTFGLIRQSSGRVVVQSMKEKGSLTSWKNWYTLTPEEEAQYNTTEGIPFRIVRIGTEFSLYIGDKMVAYKDFAESIGADTKATVHLRHWGDEEVDLKFPFKVSETFDMLKISNVGSGKGKVVTQKKNHFVGDTVVLMGDGEYYCYEMKVDGVPIQLNHDGTYTFVAKKNSYTVEGTFAKRVFKDNKEWDTLEQKDGVVYLPNGGGADQPLQFYKDYSDVEIKINAKNDPNGTDADEQSPRTDIMFEFPNGKFITFSVLRVSDEQVTIQSMGGTDSLTGWENWYSFTAKEMEQYNSTQGIELRVVRNDTGFSAYVGNKMVFYKDFKKDIDKDWKATVYLRHWGDEGVKLDIPFEVNENIDKVAKIGNRYYETLEAAVAGAAENDTIVLLKDTTIEAKMNVKKTITITNAEDVTITRGNSLYEVPEAFSIWPSGNMTIKGAEGTNFTITGGSEEAVNSRFAWVDGSLKLDNVNVQDFNSQREGGAFVYNRGGSIEFNKSTFTNNKTVQNGAVVYNEAGTVNVIDSSFIGNIAKGNGGAIYNADSGTLNLTGQGTFENNTAKGALAANNFGGGAICVGTGTLYVDGYSFVGNISEQVAGGAITLVSDGIEATIKNCQFDSNQSTVSSSESSGGGAIMASMKTLNIEGTTFTKNTTNGIGGAICAFTGDLTVTSSTFGGDTAEAANSAHRGGAIYSGASADVTLNKVAEYTTEALFQNNKATDRGGAIAIGSGSLTVEGYRFTSNSCSNEGGAIHLATDPIACNVLKSTFTQNSAIKGGAIFSNSTAQLKIDGGNFTGNTAFTGGAVYGNKTAITVDKTQGIPVFSDNQTEGAGAVIRTDGSSNVTINGGTFSNNKVTGNEVGGVIYLPDPGTLTVNGGSFVENEAQWGGVLALYSTEGVTINAGVKFENNKARSDGGAIYVAKSDLELTIGKDVEFTGNVANNDGGAIYSVGKITDNGAIYTGNKADNHEGGAVRMKNSTATFDGSMFRNNTAMTGGAICGENATITIDKKQGTPEFSGNQTTGAGAVIRTYGSSNITINGGKFSNNKVIKTDSDEVGGVIYLPDTGTLTVNGGSFVGNEAYTGGAFALYSTTNATINSGVKFNENKARGNGGAIYVAKSDFELTVGKNVEFTGNVANNDGGAIYSVGKITDNGAIYTGNKADNHEGGAVRMKNSTATFDGSIFRNNTALTGGAICGENATITIDKKQGSPEFSGNQTTGAGAVIRTYGSSNITINGGTFSNNKVTGGEVGGVIYLPDTGTLTVNGGSFVGNEANRGGALALYNSKNTTIKSGVELKENTARSNGGAIFVNGNASVTLEKGVKFTKNVAKAGGGGAIFSYGTIDDNGAIYTENDSMSYAGGAVRIETGTASFAGATFDRNKTGGEGGAIYLANESTLTINGGLFVGNTAGNRGGALGLYSSKNVTITSGAEFKENTAVNTGGAIHLDGKASVTIEKGVKFTENIASNAGGGAIYSYGTIIDNGAIYIENDAKNSAGGAVRIQSGTATFTGATFDGNETKSEGGAIYVEWMMKITVDDCTFKNNKGSRGGAIYNNNDKSISGSTIKNSRFEGNDATNGSPSGDDLMVQKATLENNKHDFNNTNCVVTSW